LATQTEAFDPARCPLCGGDNDCLLCSATACQGRCWCAYEHIPAELLALVPEPLRNRACICRSCLENFASSGMTDIRAPGPGRLEEKKEAGHYSGLDENKHSKSF